MKTTRIITLVFCLMITLVQCDNILPKGPAKFCESRNSEISKERNVFVSYYEAAPFEYQDSVFFVKLAFKEVFTEWVYWYDEKDKKFKPDTVVNSQRFVVLYDTSQTILGEIDTMFYSKAAPCPINHWSIKNPGHGAMSEGFTGFALTSGERNYSYGDTVVVPITSSCIYDSVIGFSECPRLPFGEIIFIRKKMP